MTDTVTVFDLSGVEHIMTVQNANDVIQNLKWTRAAAGSDKPPAGDLDEDVPDYAKRGSNTAVKMFDMIDREGNTHNLNEASAFDMQRHLGWTFAVNRLKEAPASDPVEVPMVPTPVEPTEPVVTPAASDSVDLTAMSRDELAAYALAHFDMKFSDDVSQEDILEDLLAQA